MVNKILIGILFTLFSGIASGEDIVSTDLKGFKKITNYPVYLPENLWDFINGAADNYLALGFEELHVAEYRKGRDVIKLEIYRHRNHTMAFGIYASERSPSFNFTNLGAQGYIEDGSINYFKGNYYVKIRTFSEKPKILSAAQSLAYRVADLLQGETSMPSMLAEFPSEGKKPNEETFINESVLGHEFLNSAFKAPYGVGSDNFSIYLMKFDSAPETLKTAESYLASAGIEAGPSEEGRFVFTDGYNGTVFLSWKENQIVIITGLAKDQANIADRYTTEILN
jgi:hypothetical protein